MSDLKHIILMRYNLRCPGFTKSSDPEWMKNRCELFENRMMPSLYAQTNQNFVCVPLMDRPRTPEDIYKRVESWRCDVIQPAWFGDEFAVDGVMYDSPPLWPICEAAVRIHTADLKLGGVLVTTRMDSDDAIHEKFVETTQQEAKPNTLEFLNFYYGWLEKGGVYYPDEHGKNMFITLVEPFTPKQPPLTVHRVWHKKASTLAPIRQIGGTEKMWLRGIHSENKSSKIRGRNTAYEPVSLDKLEGFHVTV
jgi:hypothetical protein